MRGIVDDDDVTRLRDGAQRIEVGRETAEVHRNDRLRTVGDRRGDVPRVDVQCSRIDIDDHRPGAEVEDHFRGRREGVCGDDDLVVAREADRFEGEVQRRGARVQRDGVFRTDERGELALELVYLLAGREPARLEHGAHALDLIVPDVRPREGNHRVYSSSARPSAFVNARRLVNPSGS